SHREFQSGFPGKGDRIVVNHSLKVVHASFIQGENSVELGVEAGDLFEISLHNLNGRDFICADHL
ncbi:MAG TPA: hypothetical protein VMU10_05425, partial [Desulfomonilia bacterium]|nr:hypothetical protein [Desulfomonilia bacterium]